jgi:hypothetical protein
MLTLYRQHKPTCPHFSEGRKFHHCKCAIWADGILGGREVRRSIRTRDWTKANREIRKWEAAERVKEQGAPVSLADAWGSFLSDLEAGICAESGPSNGVERTTSSSTMHFIVDPFLSIQVD